MDISSRSGRVVKPDVIQVGEDTYVRTRDDRPEVVDPRPRDGQIARSDLAVRGDLIPPSALPQPSVTPLIPSCDHYDAVLGLLFHCLEISVKTGSDGHSSILAEIKDRIRSLGYERYVLPKCVLSHSFICTARGGFGSYASPPPKVTPQ
jgi:hypothetical protein